MVSKVVKFLLIASPVLADHAESFDGNTWSLCSMYGCHEMRDVNTYMPFSQQSFESLFLFFDINYDFTIDFAELFWVFEQFDSYNEPND